MSKSEEKVLAERGSGLGSGSREEEGHGDLAFLAVGYSLASCSLSLLNKWALSLWPYPGTLTSIHFFSAALVVYSLKVARLAEVDDITFRKAMAFAPAVAMFYISIAANMQLLSIATVDTFVVVRALAPLFTQAGDVLICGGARPPWPSLVGLGAISASALGYAHTNRDALTPVVLWWAFVYLFAMVVDTLLVKRVVTDVPLSPWGVVLYNNALALFLYPLWISISGELGALQSTGPGGALGELGVPSVALTVAASCVVGLAISYFGLNTRKALSATSFTVLGVANKFATIGVNAAVWSAHAPPAAMACACAAIAGSVVYAEAVAKHPPLAALARRGAERARAFTTRVPRVLEALEQELQTAPRGAALLATLFARAAPQAMGCERYGPAQFGVGPTKLQRQPTTAPVAVATVAALDGGEPLSSPAWVAAAAAATTAAADGGEAGDRVAIEQGV